MFLRLLHLYPVPVFQCLARLDSVFRNPAQLGVIARRDNDVLCLAVRASECSGYRFCLKAAAIVDADHKCGVHIGSGGILEIGGIGGIGPVISRPESGCSALLV